MEGKAVIMGLLILGLVVGEIEGKSCCRSTFGRNCYNTCRFFNKSRPTCSGPCGCKIISEDICPSEYPRAALEMTSVTPSSVSDYCKLGCSSSVCDNMSGGLSSGAAEEEVEKAMEHCNNACTELCNNKLLEHPAA